jgi:hypothetical protein
MYLAHYTKRFIPEFDAECRLEHSFSRFSCASFEWLYEVRDEIEMVVHEFSVPLIRVNQVFQ